MPDDTLEALLPLKPRQLKERLRAGHAIDPDALDGLAYQGVSLGMPAWIDRLAWKTFQKAFRSDPATGELRGWNVRLQQHGMDCEIINKVVEGRPHIVDSIKNGEIVYIVNTTEGRSAINDSFSIRREALQHRVTYSTTIAGAKALVDSLEFRGTGPVWSLQELHKELNA